MGPPTLCRCCEFKTALQSHYWGSNQGQKWSIFLIQRPELLQWWARSGFLLMKSASEFLKLFETKKRFWARQQRHIQGRRANFDTGYKIWVCRPLHTQKCPWYKTFRVLESQDCCWTLQSPLKYLPRYSLYCIRSSQCHSPVI